MANHERLYDIEVKFIHPKNKQEVKFNMRSSIWSLDQAILQKSLMPDKELNIKEMWISRLLDCIEGMDDSTARNLDQYTMNYLITNWLQYNDPSSSFLGLEIPDESQKITTP